ncbi:hypothetical protein [Pilimelia columellifera]|uniref:hypothetical protein n=1 Tax=Pilimelia columellifera TaxID=706574 RepID=UPI0031DBB934
MRLPGVLLVLAFVLAALHPHGAADHRSPSPALTVASTLADATASPTRAQPTATALGAPAESCAPRHATAQLDRSVLTSTPLPRLADPTTEEALPSARAHPRRCPRGSPRSPRPDRAPSRPHRPGGARAPPEAPVRDHPARPPARAPPPRRRAHPSTKD